MEVNVGRIRQTNTTEVMLAQMEVKCDDLIGQLHDAHDLIRSMLPDREVLRRDPKYADQPSDTAKLGSYHEDYDDYHRQELEALEWERDSFLQQDSYDRVELHTPALLRCAVGIIEEHGPVLRVDQFSQSMYDANKWARKAVNSDHAGGMLPWLRSRPETFDIHGEGGYLGVSLRDSAERPPTEAGLHAQMPGAGPSPPVRQGSDAASVTTNASTKLLMGRAAARRGRTTGDTRRMLNRIVHAPDPDPHRVERNEFVDEEGRALKGVMRAALRKGKENGAMDGAHHEQ